MPSYELSCFTFKGNYVILAVRNYKMQVENRSYLIAVKLLHLCGLLNTVKTVWNCNLQYMQLKQQ